jgi:hypothetical protein
MTVLTHCLPSGALGTSEIPVCNVDTGNTTIYLPTGGIGNSKIRGIVVSMHGLPTTNQPIPPVVSADVQQTAFDSYGASFRTMLVNDGWAYLCVPYPEDFYVGVGSQAIYNDISSDSGHGSRYLAMTLHWWDHVVNFIHTTYGNWPIVATGESWGGWHTLQVAAGRQSTIVGYSADVPATIISNANTAFTTPVNFSLINTTGADITTTQLNTVTVPGIVTYGTNDEAVGYNSAGTGGTPISNTDAMLTNAAAAGAPITRNATADFHEFTNADSGTWFTPTGPTALSSLGTLTVNANYDFVSGQCAIYASDGQWHTITFTGTSGTTQFTGCTYSGTTSATVSAGAPVCMTGTGAVGNHQMSLPYWFATTLDPLYPKTY